MDEGRNYDVWPSDALWARGMPVIISKHAEQSASAERPEVNIAAIIKALEAPDHDDGRAAFRWVGGRTLIVRYEEKEGCIYVLTVSATRSRLQP